jgi:transglutaminase-like putative cysteine protease
MKLGLKVFILILLLFTLQKVHAIDFPKSVNYLSVELTQYGEIELRRATNSRIERIEALLFLPKDDARQEVEILSVTPMNYEILDDEYGNERIKLIWLNPKENFLEYEIRTRVKIFSRRVLDAYDERFLEETELTKPNEEIIEKALEFKDKGLEGLAEMAIWMNENIVYDEALGEEVKPASWVFTNRRGTCDEFSNLFISMTRSLGLPSRYVTGLAYSEGFDHHAWVEVFVNDEWVPFDPTWLEAGYLDATHLKIANLPDGNSTERILIRGFNVDVVWTPSKYRVEILEEREDPPLRIAADTINEKIPPNGYSIFKASIDPEECMILSLTLKSCVRMDESIFEVFGEKKNLFSCDPFDVYWTIRQKKAVEKGFIYTCPLTLNTESGIFAVENVTIDPEERMEGFRITPEKVVTTPGKKFKISITPEKKIELYYLFLNKLTSVPLEDKTELEFDAPEDVGKYELWFIGSDGSGSIVELKVLKKKFVEILSVEFRRVS